MARERQSSIAVRGSASFCADHQKNTRGSNSAANNLSASCTARLHRQCGSLPQAIFNSSATNFASLCPIRKDACRSKFRASAREDNGVIDFDWLIAQSNVFRASAKWHRSAKAAISHARTAVLLYLSSQSFAALAASIAIPTGLPSVKRATYERAWALNQGSQTS